MSPLAAIPVLGATFVVFCYLLFIWWLDRYEREPIWMVLLTFAYGGIFGTMFGCALSALPAAIVQGIVGGASGQALAAVFVAPPIEEATKGAVLALLVFSREFDNETDGLIYGAATGLGFACVENLLYFAGAHSLDALVHLVVLRTAFTALVHCISSASLGMAVALAKQRKTFVGKAGTVLAGYAVAVANHGTWNAMASATGLLHAQPGVAQGVFGLGMLLVVIASIVMFCVTQFALLREKRFIRTELEAEAKRGTLPAEHAPIIASWFKRGRGGWLDPKIPRKEYVDVATQLAFRNHELTWAKGKRREAIVKDIAASRQELLKLQGRG